jgi:hypothetical protein
MNLDSFKSLENELTKNIPAFYKELLKTWITCRGRENKSPHNFRETNNLNIHFICKAFI